MANLREELAKMFRENYGIELSKPWISRKPYLEHFDGMPCPPGYKVPDFVKFSGEGTKTTREYVSQYLAQLGEANTQDASKVCYSPLSLSGTAFS